MITSARRWEPLVLLDVVIAEIIRANPGVTEAKLRMNLTLNPDGSIHDWCMQSGLLIQSLPELFGAVRTTGNLMLQYNSLSSLPDSFGSIEVGGDLELHSNQLSSLPDSFGSLSVGGNLYLYSNQLR